MRLWARPVTLLYSNKTKGTSNFAGYATLRKRPIFAKKKSQSLSPNIANFEKRAAPAKKRPRSPFFFFAERARRKEATKKYTSQENNLVKSATSVVPKALNAGKFSQLSEVDREQRSLHKNLLDNVTDFEALKINEQVREAVLQGVLKNVEKKRPTPIQILSTKMIRKTRKTANILHTWLMAAETGSGKTLAYLAPLLSNIKDAQVLETPEDQKIGKVKCIILVPTSELARQLSKVLAEISAITPFTTFALVSKTELHDMGKKLSRSLDVLICTPEKLVHLFGSRFSGRYLHHCQSIVVDEADTLMDESFSYQTLEAIKMCPNITDLVFCSATIPRRFDKQIKEIYPEATRIVTPNIHKMPSRVDFRVIEVFKQPYNNDKDLALLQALYAIHHETREAGLVKRVVVFVNKRDDVDKMVEMLKSKGHDAVGVNKYVAASDRKDTVEDFIDSAKPLTEEAAQVKVLVATDLLARGVDMKDIKNVILYDMPYSSVDLLHRVGRTGRMNKRGRVLLFVNKKESQGWIKGLQKAVNQGLSLA